MAKDGGSKSAWELLGLLGSLAVLMVVKKDCLGLVMVRRLLVIDGGLGNAETLLISCFVPYYFFPFVLLPFSLLSLHLLIPQA